MKLLLCHNYYIHSGGESLVFENEIHGLQKQGHEVVLYTKTNQDIQRLSLSERVKVFLSGYHSKRTKTEITSIIERERPDVALVQNIFPLISPSIYMTSLFPECTDHSGCLQLPFCVPLR